MAITAPVILNETSPIESLKINKGLFSKESFLWSLNNIIKIITPITTIAGKSYVKVYGVRHTTISLAIPPPRAVKKVATKIPNKSSLFRTATKKPLMAKAIIPIYSVSSNKF